MKKIKFLIAFVMAATVLGCSDDDSSVNLDNVAAPTDISALFTITQDNTGLVTIAPRGNGVTTFHIHFGDGTEDHAEVRPGNTINHVYAEGIYTVKIIGKTLNGLTAEYEHELTVSFREPENLAVTIAPVAGDSFSINVSATADYEAFFEVWFGEDPDQEPVQFNQGETVTHTYSDIGTYEVRVVAYSGGEATTEVIQEVTITNPLLLPVNFESTTLNYAFSDFGGAATSVIDNPHPEGINTSQRVGQSVKTPGAEGWAGTALTLDEDIDFSAGQYFRIKVWSPAASTPVLLKLENIADANIFYEVQESTTVAEEWEYLTFNFSGADMAQAYSKVILFFNFNINGNGETYYFDDISLIAGEDALNIPLNFESPTINYVFNGFGGAGGGKVANPDASGINTSANVGEVTKSAGAEVWAGIAIPMTNPIDFSSQQKIKMKVWSPAANTPVLLKLENIPNSDTFVEVQVTTTTANTWEELTFDFTGINNANNYQMVVLFFDFGNVGTGATYYFDDVQLSN